VQLNFGILAAAAVLIGSGSISLAEKKPADTRTDAEIEAATRLQVFLNRANFGPGKIDGHYGDFTKKALALYRKARGEEGAPAASSSSSGGVPNIEGLDLANVDPVFIEYTVTDADLGAVGELPEKVEEKAKLKWLPYVDALEAVAEKFHSDRDFIAQLNPGAAADLKAGDRLKVPNVEPFDVETLKQKKDAPAKEESKDPAAAAVTVKVRSDTNMLELYEDEKLTAAYPVTIGARDNESPAGDWKVKGVALLPTFRHDESMLKRGERSSEFHMLQPGPNNPVGVVWIALTKDGIGLHGTDDPDAVGRASSHGCVRLANWDIVRLLPKVKSGVPVLIQ
jgi:lipoprotein-anchoring transpeptidase ErfK/SrfK